VAVCLLLSAHHAVIFAIGQLSCYMCVAKKYKNGNKEIEMKIIQLDILHNSVSLDAVALQDARHHLGHSAKNTHKMLGKFHVYQGMVYRRLRPGALARGTR